MPPFTTSSAVSNYSQLSPEPPTTHQRGGAPPIPRLLIRPLFNSWTNRDLVIRDAATKQDLHVFRSKGIRTTTTVHRVGKPRILCKVVQRSLLGGSFCIWLEPMHGNCAQNGAQGIKFQEIEYEAKEVNDTSKLSVKVNVRMDPIEARGAVSSGLGCNKGPSLWIEERQGELHIVKVECHEAMMMRETGELCAVVSGKGHLTITPGVVSVEYVLAAIAIVTQ